MAFGRRGGSRRMGTGILSAGGGGEEPPGEGEIIFQDGFEGPAVGALPSFVANGNGIRWNYVNDPYVSVTDLISRSGTKSLQFHFGDSLVSEGPFARAELGFQLSTDDSAQLLELYKEFWLYLPTGAEGTLGPEFEILDEANNKFFRLWGSDSAATNPNAQVGASMFGDGSDTNADVNAEFMCGGVAAMGEGGSCGYGDTFREPFLGSVLQRGVWQRIRIRARVATVANNDGLIQIWVGDTLVIDRQDLPNYAASTNYFTRGYLMGYLNSGATAEMSAFMDDVVFSINGFAT